MSRYAEQLTAELRELGTEERAVNEKRYLKSPPGLQHFGVTVPAIRKAVRQLRNTQPELKHDDLTALVKELWSAQAHETRMAAIELLDAYNSLLVQEDSKLVERMIDESHTWAYVDGLSATVMGGLIGRYPEVAGVLDRWAEHPNFWLRRAAMLSLLDPIRKGAGDFERFGRYADSMLHEKEFFIRKAIGWVLREASKKRPELVYEWLVPRAHRCSTLTVREAVKYLPAYQAQRLIAASRSGVAMK